MQHSRSFPWTSTWSLNPEVIPSGFYNHWLVLYVLKLHRNGTVVCTWASFYRCQLIFCLCAGKWLFTVSYLKAQHHTNWKSIVLYKRNCYGERVYSILCTSLVSVQYLFKTGLNCYLHLWKAFWKTGYSEKALYRNN